jgi:hypothetical protein
MVFVLWIGTLWRNAAEGKGGQYDFAWPQHQECGRVLVDIR